MIKDCQNAMKKKKKIIRECEDKLHKLRATRKDLKEALSSSTHNYPWQYRYQQGYVSKKADIEQQPVKVNRKTGYCYVLVRNPDSTYYCFREYWDIKCEDFVKWLTKKRKEDK